MRRVAAFYLLACGLLACGNSTQPTVLDPAQLLSQGGAAMARLHSVTATLTFTKGQVSFEGFALASARTSVRLPDESDTVYTVKEQDFTVDIEVVITGGQVYLKLPFSGFQLLGGSEAAVIPDLAKLFDPSTGLPAVIPAGHNPHSGGQDTIAGVASQIVLATYTADQIHSMLAALSSSGDISARIWLGASDHLIRKAVLDGNFGDGGKESALEVDIGGFDSSVSITSPAP